MNLKVIPNSQFFTLIEHEIRSGGSVELRIKGTSMHPTLKSDRHKVVLVPFRQEHLRVGTIALFTYNGRHILHRLVAIDGDVLIFQGDNLPFTYERVQKEDVIAFGERIITPQGKIIDCNKRGFYIRSHIFVWLNRMTAILRHKIRGVWARL